MIVDLERFLQAGKPVWSELERLLGELEEQAERKLELEEAKRFHYLYRRTSSDLARLSSFPAEARTRRYLESLVARAYAEIHETRGQQPRFSPRAWFFQVFPAAFRRQAWAFGLAVLITVVGGSFGGLVVYFDPDAKEVILPFAHLLGDPSERVKEEESRERDRLEGQKSSFSAFLMTHNLRVSIFTLALGMTWGIGTILMLFYNGVILGAVCGDYVLAGQTPFLAGWLLPHGAVEIPAILIAGQAGLVLGRALIGWGTSEPVSTRLRRISGDLVILIFGVAVLLAWAGVVEAFFSQYHEPVLPYSLKIAFGLVELALLALLLAWAGRSEKALNQERRESAYP